jgi:hypothetical protein
MSMTLAVRMDVPSYDKLARILVVPHWGLHVAFIGEAMETELCAGNLVFSTTEEELQTLFTQAGAQKSVAIIQARDTNRGKSAGAAVTGATVETVTPKPFPVLLVSESGRLFRAFPVV